MIPSSAFTHSLWEGNIKKPPLLIKDCPSKIRNHPLAAHGKQKDGAISSRVSEQAVATRRQQQLSLKWDCAFGLQ